MSKLINSLDDLVMDKMIYSLGEKGHSQYKWDINSNAELENNFENDITELFFQLVRYNAINNDNNPAIQKYNNLVNSYVGDGLKRNKYVLYLLSLMFQTRDIIKGKGEYDLFIRMLRCWDTELIYNTYGSIILKALRYNFIKDENNNANGEPYGSWKDVKYYLNLVGKDNYKNSFISNFLINLLVKQIIFDSKTVYGNISLAARWAPRESKHKFGWQSKVCARQFAIFNSRKFTSLDMKAWRQTLSSLNKKLHTVQVNQCRGDWSYIKFPNDLTSITFMRQRKAFLCEGKNKSASENEDRITCKQHFEQYIQDCNSGKSKMVSKRTSLGDIVKACMKLDSSSYITEIDAINLAWSQQIDENHYLQDFIVMCDTSASMTWENCPYYDAIGLAIRIAERSTLGKRIMTFSNNPSWINLDNKETLYDMIKEIQKASVGYNTNFYKALQLICDACVKNDMHPVEVSALSLIILSDMQIDTADKNWSSMDDGIREMFSDAGKKTSHGVPYEPPTLIYWNMRTTKGFPCSTTKNNTIMVSGYSIEVISNLSTQGTKSLKEMTPWKNLEQILNQPRYNWFWD